jgi:hypothetical protein
VDETMTESDVAELRAKLAAAQEGWNDAERRCAAGELALELMQEVRNPLEALAYLAFLTRQDADNPEKVRDYMRQAEEQMSILGEVAGRPLEYARRSPAPRLIELSRPPHFGSTSVCSKQSGFG